METKGPPLTSFTYAMPFSQSLGLGTFGFPAPGQGPDPAWWQGLNKLFLLAGETNQFDLKALAEWFNPAPSACLAAAEEAQRLRELSFLQLTEYDLSGIFLLQLGGARRPRRGPIIRRPTGRNLQLSLC